MYRITERHDIDALEPGTVLLDNTERILIKCIDGLYRAVTGNDYSADDMRAKRTLWVLWEPRDAEGEWQHTVRALQTRRAFQERWDTDSASGRAHARAAQGLNASLPDRLRDDL